MFTVHEHTTDAWSLALKYYLNIQIKILGSHFEEMTRCETSHSVSSFLSAAETVARQRQNVQRDLKKMDKKSRAVELALESHNFVYFWFVLYRKRFQLQ